MGNRMYSRIRFKICLTLFVMGVVSSAICDDVVYNIRINKSLFYPDTITVPSGRRFKLVIDNEDSSPEEFDSFELNREKVIMGKASAVIYIGPLKPGTYPFFGEFNPETAQGKLIVTPAIEEDGRD
jgi:hypothetical protein